MKKSKQPEFRKIFDNFHRYKNPVTLLFSIISDLLELLLYNAISLSSKKAEKSPTEFSSIKLWPLDRTRAPVAPPAPGAPPGGPAAPPAPPAPAPPAKKPEEKPKEVKKPEPEPKKEEKEKDTSIPKTHKLRETNTIVFDLTKSIYAFVLSICKPFKFLIPVIVYLVKNPLTNMVLRLAKVLLWLSAFATKEVAYIFTAVVLLLVSPVLIVLWLVTWVVRFILSNIISNTGLVYTKVDLSCQYLEGVIGNIWNNPRASAKNLLPAVYRLLTGNFIVNYFRAGGNNGKLRKTAGFFVGIIRIFFILVNLYVFLWLTSATFAIPLVVKTGIYVLTLFASLQTRRAVFAAIILFLSIVLSSVSHKYISSSDVSMHPSLGLFDMDSLIKQLQRAPIRGDAKNIVDFCKEIVRTHITIVITVGGMAVYSLYRVFNFVLTSKINIGPGRKERDMQDLYREANVEKHSKLYLASKFVIPLCLLFSAGDVLNIFFGNIKNFQLNPPEFLIWIFVAEIFVDLRTVLLKSTLVNTRQVMQICAMFVSLIICTKSPELGRKVLLMYAACILTCSTVTRRPKTRTPGASEDILSTVYFLARILLVIALFYFAHLRLTDTALRPFLYLRTTSSLLLQLTASLLEKTNALVAYLHAHIVAMSSLRATPYWYRDIPMLGSYL